jgi:Putative transposase
MLVLDGVYANERGKLRFQPLPAPATMTRLLEVIVLRVLCCLERDGLLNRDPEQPGLDLVARDPLDALGAASIQYRIAVGPQAGRKVLTLKLAAPAARSNVAKPFTVARAGFSLNAAVACAPHQRERIERLCRYITRPALALERLSTNGQGRWSTKSRRRTGMAPPILCSSQLSSWPDLRWCRTHRSEPDGGARPHTAGGLKNLDAREAQALRSRHEKTETQSQCEVQMGHRPLRHGHRRDAPDHAAGANCAKDGAYEGLFVSAPLNVAGGTGSPPNAPMIE